MINKRPTFSHIVRGSVAMRKILSVPLFIALLPIPHTLSDLSRPENTARTVSRVPLGSNSPYMAPTAGKFAKDCKSDKAGCAGVIGNVLIDSLQLTSKSGSLCLPGVNYTKAVPSWIADHPKVAKMKTSEGISAALRMMYRCGRQKNNH